VFIEDGHWWIQDLQSGNGVFIEDRRIDRFSPCGIIRIRLGISGPILIFELEKAVPLKSPIPEPPVSDSRTLSDYEEHYFDQTADDTVGEHTLLVRRAYAEIKKNSAG
jgi:pSer/pThr/pTyr-binding forkhead associated (FHA) protein